MPEDQPKVTDNVLDLGELKPQLAQKILMEIVDADDGRVFFSRHAEQRMVQRGITRRQVYRCLRSGRFEEDPHWSNENGNWLMKLGVVSAGDIISVVVTLDHEDGKNYSLVISAMS